MKNNSPMFLLGIVAIFGLYCVFYISTHQHRDIINPASLPATVADMKTPPAQDQYCLTHDCKG